MTELYSRNNTIDTQEILAEEFSDIESSMVSQKTENKRDSMNQEPSQDQSSSQIHESIRSDKRAGSHKIGKKKYYCFDTSKIQYLMRHIY
jgi:hypothetical protein